MPRVCLITDALIADFCAKLRVSGNVETAISTTGIGRETYFGWQRNVHEGKGTKLEKKFMRAVEQAQGEIKLQREHKLSKHFDKNWQAIAWWLERSYPRQYAQRRGEPVGPESDGSDPERVPRIVWRVPPIPPPPKPVLPIAIDSPETPAEEPALTDPEDEVEDDQ